MINYIDFFEFYNIINHNMKHIILFLYCFCIDIYCSPNNYTSAKSAMYTPVQDRTIRESILADVASQFYEIRQPEPGESLLSIDEQTSLTVYADNIAQSVLSSLQADLNEGFNEIMLTRAYLKKDSRTNNDKLHKKITHYFILLKTIKDVGDFSQEGHSTGKNSALDILLDSKVLNLKHFVNYEGKKSTLSSSSANSPLGNLTSTDRELFQNMSSTMNLEKGKASTEMQKKFKSRDSDSMKYIDSLDQFVSRGTISDKVFPTYDALNALLEPDANIGQLYCYYPFTQLKIFLQEEENHTFQNSLLDDKSIILFIPIRIGVHYASAFVDLKNERIVIISSMNDEVHSDYIKKIADYFKLSDNFSSVVIYMNQQQDAWSDDYFTVFYSLCIMLNGLKEGINRAHEILNKKTMSRAGDIEEWIKLIKGETSDNSSSGNVSSIENFQLAVKNKVFEKALQEFVKKYELHDSNL